MRRWVAIVAVFAIAAMLSYAIGNAAPFVVAALLSAGYGIGARRRRRAAS